MFEKMLKSVIPYSRGLFQTIKHVQKFANEILLIEIDMSQGLLHEDLLLKFIIEKCVAHI